MKLFRPILATLITVILVLLTSCGGNPEIPFVGVLETDIEGTTVVLKNDMGGKVQIKITSNMDWRIENDAEWLGISPEAGEGDKTVTIYFDENTTEEDISTELKITGSHEGEVIKTLKYTLILKGKEPFVGTLSTSLPEEGVTLSKIQPGEFNITIKSNMTWTITHDANWMEFVRDKGTGDGTVRCIFGENKTGADLTATVFITGTNEGKEHEKLEYKFTLPQQGVIDTDISGNSLTLSDMQPGETTIKVLSNLNWKIEYKAEWLTFAPLTGAGDSDVKCSFVENNGDTSLKTMVNFVAYNEDGEAARLAYEFILPPKDKLVPVLSTDLESETVTLSDLQPDRFNIKITSNIDWKIETEAAWLTFSPDTGAGPWTTECMFGTNDTGSAKEAKVYFVGYYRDTEVKRLEYKFILPPKDTFDPILSTDLGSSSVTLPIEQPGNFPINITSNMEWYFENTVSWLGFTYDRGIGDGTVNCTFSKNTTGKDQKTTVYLIGLQSVEINGETVKRERARLTYEFILPPQPVFEGVLETDLEPEDDEGTITLSDDQPGEFTIKISSNLNWTISNGAPQWLSFSQVSGTENADVTCRFLENYYSQNQSTIVRIKGTHAELAEPIELEYKFVLPPIKAVLKTDITGTTITLPEEQPGSFTIDIDSSLDWEIVNGAPQWLGFSPPSGQGSAQVTCTFQENAYEQDLSTLVKIVGKRRDGVSVKTLEYTFILPGQQAPPTPMPHSWLDLPEVITDANTQFVAHFANVGGKEYRNFSMLYDKKEHIAHWIAYPMHSFYTKKNVDRTDKWAYDPVVPTQYQTNLSSSYGTMGGVTYSRGHQVASSDRLVSKEMNWQTFYYTNMTPQNADFNSAAWNQLEQWVQSKVVSDTLYVVTGAVLKTVGGNETVKYIKDTAIPNYYYKVMMKRKGDGYTAIGFWYEHKKNSDKVSTKYAKSIREIEGLTGYNFFANVPKDKQDAMEAAYVASDWGL